VTPQLDAEIAGRYRLVRRLGEGGMGEVWVARHLELDVDMVVKLILPSRRQCDRAERRFRREARAAAKLKSPHVAHIHDFGRWEGHLYLVMELLVGEDLAARLARAHLTLDEATLVVTQLCRALSVVHAAGIVHRDLKPSNIFLTEVGEEIVTKLLDFGIAKALDDGRDATDTGAPIGSPGYMSPEQAMGEPVGPLSDLWSLACVTYEMIAGRRPFEGASSIRVYTEVAAGNVRPLPPSQRHASSLMAFFRQGLAREPAERFDSAAAFAEAFHRALDMPLPAAVPRPGPASAPAPRDAPTLTSDASSTLDGAEATEPTSGRSPIDRVKRVAALLAIAATVAVAAWVLWGPSSPGPQAETPMAASAPAMRSAALDEPTLGDEPTATIAEPGAPPQDGSAAAAEHAVPVADHTGLAPPKAPPRAGPRPAASPTTATSVDPFSGLPYPED
jgi:serine/threonine-protein kinase